MQEKAQLETLYEISKAISSSLNVEKTVPYVLRLLKKLMGFERITLTLYDPLKEEIVVKATSSGNIQGEGFKKGEGITGKVWKYGVSMVIPDISKEPAFLNKVWKRENLKDRKISFIAVPIKVSGKVVGVLSADKELEKKDSIDEYVKFLNMVATLIGNAYSLQIQITEERENLESEKRALLFELRKIFENRKIEGIVGKSPKILQALDIVHRVAPTNATVLLMGESGVGKELFAKAIHFLSPRANKPFIAINCAAIPPDLLEAELFGYEKGAFTGAYTSKKGKFELANGGTIFLDEIGDMPLNLQAKLLRVLQEKEVERIGSSKPIKIDVRIIAATNRNLEKLVREGRFREDLYYRINVVPIYIPPLRERKEDIPVLVNYFLEVFNKEYGKNVKVSKEVFEVFLNYHWPGNVRELRNVLERMVILDTDGILTYEDLPTELLGYRTNTLTISEKGKTIWEVEKELIESVLKECNYVIKEAAKKLGMTPRQVSYRIKKYGIKLKR